MRRWVYFLAFFLIAFSALPVFAAQDAPTLTDLGVTHAFGGQITFRVRVQPGDEIRHLLVFITPEGQPTVWKQFSEIETGQTKGSGEYTQSVDSRQLALYPFSTISYRYEASLKNGGSVTSETNTFVYNDDRFSWQDFTSGIFEIHWYGDDSTLGQQIANIAGQGLQQAQTIIARTPPAPLRIYAYNTTRDLQTAMQFSNQSWVAGHTTPELNLILISVPTGPEKTLELERQIPHEITHILQYQVMGSTYKNLPMWLSEGMASLSETYPNPEYRRVLQAAAQSGQFLPFRDLCSTFPHEAAPAFQAYAQSESFAQFLKQKFGAEGFSKLMKQYQNGVGCEEGVSLAFGTALSPLEYRWQQEVLGVNSGGLALRKISPYLLLGLLVLGPAALAFLPKKRTGSVEKHA